MQLKQKLTLLFLLACNTTYAATSNQSVYELSFSTQVNNGIPLKTEQQRFDCSSQIYSIINASNLASEPVSATIIWRNPTGEIQEQTPISLYPVEGEAFGWAWLKLHKGTGAALLSFFDDSIGMDEFIGDWEIELMIENKRVARNNFNVLC